jgi:hypothetical protein
MERRRELMAARLTRCPRPQKQGQQAPRRCPLLPPWTLPLLPL